MSIELKDAYFHILMSRNSRKYVQFMVNGHVYQWKGSVQEPGMSIFCELRKWALPSVASCCSKTKASLHNYGTVTVVSDLD